MVKVLAKNSARTLVMLGLSKENVERLQGGACVKIRLKEMVDGLEENIVIGLFYGQTDEKIEADFKAAGLIGPGTEVRS